MPQVSTSTKTLFADLSTPVAMYLRVRDRFPHTLLLESADYRGQAGSWSFICIKPRTEFRVTDSFIQQSALTGEVTRTPFASPRVAAEVFEKFVSSYVPVGDPPKIAAASGLFGYMTYDAIECFEDIVLTQDQDPHRNIPRMIYSAYEYVIACNHARNEMHLVRHAFSGDPHPGSDEEYDSLCALAEPRPVNQLSFKKEGAEMTNFDDQEYQEVIAQCQRHIARGDVFQIVPSRRFEQAFNGDEFEVYRALRSINPSPYLFYFDFGSFRLFGSSPEAQLIVKERKAEVHPIAGTYRRTGDEVYDAERAQELLLDEKENAEHVMLVDLGRNDLSIHCNDVKVEAYREIQYYSHVIHLVSKVRGTLKDDRSAVAVLGATFPAGTLSGAPKYRAMELIDRYERGRRYFYGGALGVLGFDGSCNHAIMIRSFLSKNNRLFCQAGGGVVADSRPADELQESNNKLAALKRAVVLADDQSRMNAAGTGGTQR